MSKVNSDRDLVDELLENPDKFKPVSGDYRENSCDLHIPGRGCTNVIKITPAPKIVLTEEVYNQLIGWGRCADGIELSVFGRITRDRWEFRLEELFLPRQVNHAAHTVPDKADLTAWLREQGREEEMTKNLWVFWGHFHPGSMEGPSATDEASFSLYNTCTRFHVAGIFPRSGGVANFMVFDNLLGIRIDRVEWEIEKKNNPQIQLWSDEARQKLFTQTFVMPDRQPDVRRAGFSQQNNRYWDYNNSYANGSFCGR